MSRLRALKDIDPKDVARLLSTVSTSVLPNPGIGDVIEQTGTDAEFVQSVLAEIRNFLRVQPRDLSLGTQSRIYAFLSDEISKVALVNVDMHALKNRLGRKGELHPSQYDVRFGIDFDVFEALGIRKNHVIDAINHPDRLQHFPLNRQVQKSDAPITLSMKFIESKKREDRFVLLVISARDGQVQVATGAYRIYFSDVDLNGSNEPLDFLKAFVKTHGLRFRFGDYSGDMALDELVQISSRLRPDDLRFNPHPIEGLADYPYCPMSIGAETAYKSLSNTTYYRIGIALVLDVPKYVAALRKHNIRVTPEDQWRFPRIGQI
jgi:hypothetical protein